VVFKHDWHTPQFNPARRAASLQTSQKMAVRQIGFCAEWKSALGTLLPPLLQFR
jgi:hypothetical protein